VVDGHEAIRRIRAMTDATQPKIVAVTASALDENRQELIGIGADDFISKPFRETELFQKIRAQTGVEYEYAEEAALVPPGETAPLTPQSLKGLPPDLLAALRDAVVTADLDQMLAQIENIETRDPGIGRHLRRLAEDFEYEKLLRLLGGPAGDAH
jgi:CheY-like chemotaxis protein